MTRSVILLMVVGCVSAEAADPTMSSPDSDPWNDPPPDYPVEVVLEPATVETAAGTEIQYELGTLRVPENRSNPESRIIGVGFARIKSLSATGAAPTFHLPGGPGNTILERLKRPEEAQKLLQYLAVGDVVLVEQRGYTTRGEQLLSHYQSKPQSLTEPTSLDSVKAAAAELARATVAEYANTEVDLTGYTVLECADDVNDLRRALGYRKISLVGQSFGSQWSFAIMRRHPRIVERALLSGVEPLDNGYDMPSYVMAALQRMAWDANQNPRFQPHLPEGGLMVAVREVINRLRAAPVSVQVTDPWTHQTDTVVLGVGDFQLLLSLSGEPESILAVYRGDYARWGAQIREFRLSGGVGRGRGDELRMIVWLIDTSLGVTPAREHQLRTDPAIELLGTWTFDMFMSTADIWPTKDVGDEFRTPVLNRTPVLFIAGDWDTSTPIENTLSMLPYFPNAHTLLVHRGPHGARGDWLETDRPDVMQAVFEFLRSGGTEQLPVSVEIPYP